MAGVAGAPGGTDGVGTGLDGARLDHPAGVAVNLAQPWALISDSGNNALRKLEVDKCGWTARPTPAPPFVRYTKGEKPSPAPAPTPLSAAGTHAPRLAVSVVAAMMVWSLLLAMAQQ